MAIKRGIALGDTHCGCLSGLTPPRFMIPEKRSKHLHQLQAKAWHEYEKIRKDIGQIDFLIGNGDLIDGKGSRSGGTEIMEPDLIDQCEMAIDCLLPWNAKKTVLTYGTAYHVNAESGEDFENIIAHALNAEIKSHAFINIDGVVFDVKHHCGSSGIPHGRHTAIAKERLWNLLWSEREEQPKSNILLRSHVHHHTFAGGPGWLAMTLPALQLAHTKYGARRCNGTIDWGLVYFEIENRRLTKWVPFTRRIVSANSDVINL